MHTVQKSEKSDIISGFYKQNNENNRQKMENNGKISNFEQKQSKISELTRVNSLNNGKHFFSSVISQGPRITHFDQLVAQSDHF